MSLVFVSAGDGEKLATFLDSNPGVPRGQVFVDDSPAFDAYEAAGFTGKMGEVEPPEGYLKGMRPPALTGAQWWGYLKGMGRMMKGYMSKGGEFPQEVLRLGGTFALRGPDLAYAWADTVPGDYPAVDEVLEVVGA